MTEPNNEPMVLREDRDGAAHLTLNRPGQFNALSDAMLGAIIERLDAIADDPAVRAVVIGGAGKAFCAGHDLKEMRANHTLDFQQALFRKCGKLMLKIQRLPQPVIARIHGIATAAGCQLVSMCDLAVAADVARFAVSGINVGLFCSTPAVGISRNMGRKQAFEMLVTGEFIDATEAQRRGLVNRVVPLEALDEAVDKLTAAICAKTPVAVRMGKELFYRQLETGIEAAYQMASETMACNMMTEDAAEGIDAFIGKRPPQWKGC
ncbi:enoyl-CoA hydratase [Nitrogeniibacter mangrovi]|uniref:Enoyl-CoA hydratase domain-containing protein 3, mitochondrial n=1 Tax=Nitrogeniibacter mangrovi TaxID=2016596 RepID=A0A6C1B1L5_9RHOO|nr:enoyl-CoA hydratase [Nitrogeniibacter mangrovi]QID17512.1 enoyl-CoA hydratase [Nitrogeniibacter mangrovi]